MTDRERREWLGQIDATPSAVKGMYSHRDIRRVERWVKYLSERLSILGYALGDLTIKEDWSYGDDFWKEDAVRYLGNIARLRNCVTLKDTTPEAPSITDTFDYEAANNIEQILLDIDDVANRVIKSWHFAGEIFTGEV
jgi:hypothetical protein